MSRSKLAEPVDTTVVSPPWIGKRVANWWRGSTTALFGSALVLCLCAALAIWAVLDPPRPVTTDTNRGQQAELVAPPAPASDSLPSPEVVCPDQAPPADVMPEDLVNQTYITEWYPVGTMVAPRSATGGPTDARQCFARSPEGALYAVSTRLAEEVASAGGLGIHFSGYQWRSFTADKAVLLIRVKADTAAGTEYLARMFVATWDGTDWTAEPDMSAEAVKSADDPLRVFTPWGSS